MGLAREVGELDSQSYRAGTVIADTSDATAYLDRFISDVQVADELGAGRDRDRRSDECACDAQVVAR